MKINHPVTNNEIQVPEGATIVSKTDLKGIITYANPAFVAISGYSEQELLGKNHNLVRHPDMPPAAFQDLWDTVKAGKPWSGIVKNRAKSGDYYWVEATVTPLREAGNGGAHTTGYVSVRARAARDSIERAAALYRNINEGKTKLQGISMSKRLKNMSVKTKLYAVVGFFSAAMIAGGVLGLFGMRDILGSLETVYGQRLAAAGKIAAIQKRVQENRGLVADAANTPRPEVVRANGERMEKNRDQITKLWEEYFSSPALTEAERKLAERWQADRARYVDDGLNATLALLRDGKAEAARRNAREVMDPAFDRVKEGADALIALQVDLGRQEYEKAAMRHAAIRAVAIAGIALGILLAGLMAFLLMRNIANPLRAIVGYFDRISQGSYNNRIEIDREDELGKVLQELKTMQTKLNFDMTEARRLADESNRVKVALDNATTNVMIADNDGRIIYMNQAVQEMFRKAQDDLRRVYPDFDPDKLLGQNIDVFHKNPAHQRGLIQALQGTHRATIKIGNRSFNLAANPVRNGGERLGACVEWVDITDELKVQDEVNRLVDAAADGDLSRRVNLADKQGFMRHLGEGMNRLLDNVAGAMNELARVLESLARGDLTATMAGEHRGTYLKIRNDINATVEKLTEVASRIKDSSALVHTASGEIAAGNTDLSQRTEEQASSLEETASSMEELTSTVKQNADNARQANQLATDAKTHADEGAEVVTNAIGAMEEIARSSRKIADIIGVIDEIAFQTNLLALNAAVEAARAGEQGRGFAVVATEVRNLAQRSAQAAKEIKALIGNSVEQVHKGEELVEQSGIALAEIKGAVNKVVDIVAEIAAASQEQSSGIEQVNKAVMQMDEMTQQNAALVEQSAAASKSMEEQARHLADVVGFFKTGGAQSRPAPASAGHGAAKAAKGNGPADAAPAPAARKPEVRVVPPAATAAGAGNSGGDGEWEEF
jgi:methyl-accepting chemotaxis protein